MVFRGFVAAPGLRCPPCWHDFPSVSSVVVCSCGLSGGPNGKPKILSLSPKDYTSEACILHQVLAANAQVEIPFRTLVQAPGSMQGSFGGCNLSLMNLDVPPPKATHAGDLSHQKLCFAELAGATLRVRHSLSSVARTKTFLPIGRYGSH